MENSKEFEMDPKELFEQFKQVYKDFNVVLKHGDAGEKFSAVIKMDLLSKTLQEFVDTYNSSHDIPLDMINQAFEENKNEIAELKDLDRDTKEMESILSETRELMKKHSPISPKKQGKKGRLRLRRLGRRRAK